MKCFDMCPHLILAEGPYDSFRCRKFGRARLDMRGGVLLRHAACEGESDIPQAECDYCGEQPGCDCGFCSCCGDFVGSRKNLVDGYCDACDYTERGGDVEAWDRSQMFVIP